MRKQNKRKPKTRNYSHQFTLFVASTYVTGRVCSRYKYRKTSIQVSKYIETRAILPLQPSIYYALQHIFDAFYSSFRNFYFLKNIKIKLNRLANQRKNAHFDSKATFLLTSTDPIHIGMNSLLSKTDSHTASLHYQIIVFRNQLQLTCYFVQWHGGNLCST